MKRAAKMLGRALRLRCPLCGKGALFASWFKMRESCPGCGFMVEREEGYYTGAMAVNLVVAELLFVAGFVGSVILTWPAVPWNLMYGWIAVGIIGPLLFFPFSRTLWLAGELYLHPPETWEFAGSEVAADTGRR